MWANFPWGSFDYVRYWENRYRAGGTSGSGSYGAIAVWKAKVVNEIFEKERLSTVLEFGCGDGAQLGLYNFSAYTGVDVSERAIALCEAAYRLDRTKKFSTIVPGSQLELEKADLVICLEVLMHIIDDDDYEWTLKKLFELTNSFVLILNPLGGQLNGMRSRHQTDRNLLVHLHPFLSEFSIEAVMIHPSVSVRERAVGKVGDLASDFVLLRKK